MSGIQTREFYIMSDSDATPPELDDSDDETELLLWQRDDLNHNKPPKKPRQTFTTPNRKFGVPNFLATEYLSDEISEEVKNRRRSLAFNLLALSGIFLLQTIALPLYDFNVILMNIDDAQVQTICLPCLYCCTIFSGLIAPFIVQRFDAKVPILAGCIGTAVFTCSKFAPYPFLVITGAVIAGATQGLLLGGVGISLISVGSLFASYGGGTEEFVHYIFCGLANMWLLAAPVWNAIMQLLIQTDIPSRARLADDCGLGFTRKWETDEEDKDISEQLRIHAMLGTHLACTFCAVLIACFCLEPLTIRVFPNEVCQVKGSPQCWMFSDKATALIVPIFAVVGCLQCFWYSFFAQAVGDCSLSISGALYLIIITSSSSILFAAPVALLLKTGGRVKGIVLALVCDVVIFALILALKKWHMSVYIVSCIMRGLSEALYHTALTGMLPLVFRESSNFAITHFYTFKTVGCLLMFVMIRLGASILVSVSILLALIAVSVATYVPMEITVRLRDEHDKTAVNGGIIQQQDAQTWLPKLGPLGNQNQNISIPKFEDIELEDTVISTKWTD